MDINDGEETGGQPAENEIDPRTGRPKDWGALTRYAPDKQPPPESKKAGWLKKKRGAELARALLAMSYIGRSEKFNKEMMEYFGFTSLDEITNEGAIYLKQIAMAIDSGDMQAASLVIDRAYGKAKEHLNLGRDNDDERPQLNVTVVSAIEADTNIPPISDSHNEDTEVQDNSQP